MPNFKRSRVMKKRGRRRPRNTKYRGTVARIPRALPLKPKSVCQKLVYYNTFHCVPDLNSLNGLQQNYFFTIALNSPWPFINGWNDHAINNGRVLNPNSPIFPLTLQGSQYQPDAQTTSMPGLRDGYNLFRQYQNGLVVGTKVVLSAMPTAVATQNDQQSGVLYAVKHAKSTFGLLDTSNVTDIQKLPFRQIKRIAGQNDSLNMVGNLSRNTGAKIVVKHSPKKFNNVSSLRDNERFQFKQADSVHPNGQTPIDNDFLTVGIVPGINQMQGIDSSGQSTVVQKKAPDFKLSMRIEQTILFTEPLENLSEGTGNYSLPWNAKQGGMFGASYLMGTAAYAAYKTRRALRY